MSLALARLLLLSWTPLLAFSAGAQPALGASPLSRTADPIVLSGADLPSLQGLSPARIAAFRFQGGWQQIPLQVDERAFVDLGQVYDSSPVGLAPLVYTDPGTFTGADPDAGFDANDELAFMARDASQAAAGPEPAGVVPGSGVEVRITDPLQPGEVAYAYLFEHDGSLDPAAGEAYVDYDFVLLSGDYLSTYDTRGGNPEDSSVTTSYYGHHYSERWVNDELRITAGAASGVDILDRDKLGILPGYCGRTEDTFSEGPGAFVANRSGPIRAIRSYLGANSGRYTQRDHLFYDRLQTITIYHRVHEIGSSYDTFDYSPAASGMTYRNSLNQAGVIIDGQPDSVTTGALAWELVTGSQGSLVMSFDAETTIAELTITSYYVDDTTPSDDPCTGDDEALYGASGPWLLGITCTDPTRPECEGSVDDLAGSRVIYYAGPGVTLAQAIDLDAQARSPLVASARLWSSAPPVPGAAPVLLALALGLVGAGRLAQGPPERRR